MFNTKEFIEKNKYFFQKYIEKLDENDKTNLFSSSEIKDVYKVLSFFNIYDTTGRTDSLPEDFEEKFYFQTLSDKDEYYRFNQIKIDKNLYFEGFELFPQIIPPDYDEVMRDEIVFFRRKKKDFDEVSAYIKTSKIKLYVPDESGNWILKDFSIIEKINEKENLLWHLEDVIYSNATSIIAGNPQFEDELNSFFKKNFKNFPKNLETADVFSFLVSEELEWTLREFPNESSYPVLAKKIIDTFYADYEIINISSIKLKNKIFTKDKKTLTLSGKYYKKPYNINLNYIKNFLLGKTDFEFENKKPANIEILKRLIKQAFNYTLAKYENFGTTLSEKDVLGEGHSSLFFFVYNYIKGNEIKEKYGLNELKIKKLMFDVFAENSKDYRLDKNFTLKINSYTEYLIFYKMIKTFKDINVTFSNGIKNNVISKIDKILKNPANRVNAAKEIISETKKEGLSKVQSVKLIDALELLSFHLNIEYPEKETSLKSPEI